MSKSLSILLLALALISCATPYQPKGLGGGYEEAELKPGVYFLAFQGNGYTSLATVATYWHRRAAELCAERGQVPEILDTAASNEIKGAIGYTPDLLSGGFQSNSLIRKPAHTGYIRCVPSSGGSDLR